MQPPSTPSASARVPYRHHSTPPSTPVHDSKPLESYFGTPIHTQYQPPGANELDSSSSTRRRLSPSPARRKDRVSSRDFSQPRKPWRWPFPKSLRIIKRVVLWLVALLVVGSILKTTDFRQSEETDTVDDFMLPVYNKDEDAGLCQFVSPVEAYHRDLWRLRGLDPAHFSSHNHNDTHKHSHSYPHSHHLYSSTGHFIVSSDPDASHPIPLLLTLGEKRWEEVLSRQSLTLEDAVREYVRRYGRKPPKGFDVWWDFATVHNIVLPDEYDRINLDLAPFFALPKKEMKRRMKWVEQMKETFTLVIENGRVDYQILDEGGLFWDGTLPRARDAVSLIKPFARFLPDMKATFSIFDQPQIYLSWARRESLIELGLSGEVTTHLEEKDAAFVRLSRSCHPESNYRKNISFSEGRSFIYDSLEAGDLCQNPYLVPIHGLLIEPHDQSSHPRPHTQLLPLFSLTKTSINSDILITPLDQFYDDPRNDPPWEEKTSAKLAWRGSSTGVSMNNGAVDWRNSHRVRLHRFTNNQTHRPSRFIAPDLGEEIDEGDEADMPFDEEAQDQTHYRSKSNRIPTEDERALGWKSVDIPTKEMTDFFFDTKLSGNPIQCDALDGTCEDMLREIEWAPWQSAEDLNRHKFLLDLDGNGWSGRFRRLMRTNSLVIKSTLFSEWFQTHLIPWFMYIPAKLDYSDLPDILAFFRGTPQRPDAGFDETAKALAQNGKCFAERMFRLQDLQAYMMRLFLEYARIAADEGVDMDFHLDLEDYDVGYEGDQSSESGLEDSSGSADEQELSKVEGEELSEAEAEDQARKAHAGGLDPEDHPWVLSPDDHLEHILDSHVGSEGGEAAWHLAEDHAEEGADLL